MARRLTLGIISHQPIAASMAGPGIRCLELARALSGAADVILFSPGEPDIEAEGFELARYSKGSLADDVSGCDALLFQGFILNDCPELKQMGKYLIVDLYVPMGFEALGQYEHEDTARQDAVQNAILTAVVDQLVAGDFFICASERQRDYWLGMLSAVGRVTAADYAEDRNLRRLIDIVPFGIPEEQPEATGRAVKGVHPAVGEDDRLLLWGGGIYNWLDPFTPIRAMKAIAGRRNDVRLLFMGARHPDPNVPAMRAYDEAVALSRELGLYGESVIFNDRWVGYGERVNYLLEADIGVSANADHIETRFSFRTRILDCIWASLPVAATDGDSLSELVEQQGLGLVTRSGDAAGLADAIERLLDDGELYDRCRKNLKALAREFTWPQVASCIRKRLAELADAGVNRGQGPPRRLEVAQRLWSLASGDGDGPPGSLAGAVDGSPWWRRRLRPVKELARKAGRRLSRR